jgi:hypothetical protein
MAVLTLDQFKEAISDPPLKEKPGDRLINAPLDSEVSDWLTVEALRWPIYAANEPPILGPKRDGQLDDKGPTVGRMLDDFGEAIDAVQPSTEFDIAKAYKRQFGRDITEAHSRDIEGKFTAVRQQMTEMSDADAAAVENQIGRLKASTAEMMARADLEEWKNSITKEEFEGKPAPGEKPEKRSDEEMLLMFANKRRAAFGLELIDEIPGATGFVRYFKEDYRVGENIPFAGGVVEGYKYGRVISAVSQVERGQATPLDWEVIADFHEDLANAERGKTLMGITGQIIGGAFPWMIEIAATGGMAPFIKKGFREGLESVATKKLKKTIGNFIEGKLGGKVVRGAAETTGRMASESLRRLPFFSTRIGASTMRRIMPSYFGAMDESGEFVLMVAQPDVSLPRSLADSGLEIYGEIFSEATGGGISKVLGVIARPVTKALKIKPKPVQIGARDFFERLGFSNIPGEMGEEQFNRLYQEAITRSGIGNLGTPVTEQVRDPFEAARQALGEGMAFSFFGGMRAGASHVERARFLREGFREANEKLDLASETLDRDAAKLRRDAEAARQAGEYGKRDSLERQADELGRKSFQLRATQHRLKTSPGSAATEELLAKMDPALRAEMLGEIDPQFAEKAGFTVRPVGGPNLPEIPVEGAKPPGSPVVEKPAAVSEKPTETVKPPPKPPKPPKPVEPPPAPEADVATLAKDFLSKHPERAAELVAAQDAGKAITRPMLADVLKGSVAERGAFVQALRVAMASEPSPEAPTEPGSDSPPGAEPAPPAATLERRGPEVPQVLLDKFPEDRRLHAPDAVVVDDKPVKTGQAFKATTFRGSGKGATVTSGRGDDAIFGSARYTALSPEVAKDFGEDVEEVEVELRNPYIIESNDDLFNIPGMQAIVNALDRGERSDPANIKAARESLEASGYDGVVVQFPNMGDVAFDGKTSTKKVRQVFGDPQIVEFAPKAPGQTGIEPSGAVPVETAPDTLDDILEAPEEYEGQTRERLLEIATKRGIPGRGAMKRAKLIEKLKQYDKTRDEIQKAEPEDIARMQLPALRRIARELGIKGSKFKKEDLVRAILNTARKGVAPEQAPRRKGVKAATQPLVDLAREIWGDDLGAEQSGTEEGELGIRSLTFPDTPQFRKVVKEAKERLKALGLAGKVSIDKNKVGMEGEVDEVVNIYDATDVADVIERGNREQDISAIVGDLIRLIADQPLSFKASDFYNVARYVSSQIGGFEVPEASEVMDTSDMQVGGSFTMGGQRYSIGEVNDSGLLDVFAEDPGYPSFMFSFNEPATIDKGSYVAGDGQAVSELAAELEPFDAEDEVVVEQDDEGDTDFPFGNNVEQPPVDKLFEDDEEKKRTETGKQDSFIFDTENRLTQKMDADERRRRRDMKKFNPKDTKSMFGSNEIVAEQIQPIAESLRSAGQGIGENGVPLVNVATNLDKANGDAAQISAARDELAKLRDGADVDSAFIDKAIENIDSVLSQDQGMPDPTVRPPDPALGTTVIVDRMPMRMEPPHGASFQSVSPPQVIKALEKIIRIAGGRTSIRTGRFGGPWAGIFKTHSHIIRLRVANALSTATHEVGHALERVTWGFRKGGVWIKKLGKGSVEWAELIAAGKALYGDRKPHGGYASEGFAEFIRYWVTDRPSARKIMPTMSGWFDKYLDTAPKINKALNDAQDKVDRWKEQGFRERERKSRVDAGSLTERAKVGAKKVASFFSFRNHFDMLDVLFQFDKAAQKALGKKLEAHELPGKFAESIRLKHDAVVRQMAKIEMVDFNMNAVGASLEDASAIVRKAKMSHSDFVAYMRSKRSVALLKDPKGPREPGLSLEDAKAIVDELETPAIEEAAQIVYDWNQGVLNYAAQASPEFATAMKAIMARDPGYYVPLAREFEAIDMIASKNLGGKSRSGKLSGRLRGSGRRVKDPFVMMIFNARHIIKMAHERYIVDRLIELSERAEGLGYLVERVPRHLVPAASRNIEQIVKEMRKKGVTVNGELIDKDEMENLEQVITFFGPATVPTVGDNPVFTYVRNGKVEWYEVDKDVFEALTSGIEQFRFGGWARVVEWLGSKPMRVKRAGTTTLVASFGLFSNPAKDFWNFLTNSQANRNSLEMTVLWMESVARGGLKLIPKYGQHLQGPYYQMWERLGGVMSQTFAQDVLLARRSAREISEGPIIRAIDPRNWFDVFRDIVQIPESGPRVAEVRAVLNDAGWKPGMPMTIELATKARLAGAHVTTDFGASGAFSRQWNQIVPFWNAAFQGPRANVRAGKRNPRKFLMRGSFLTIATLAYWWNKKDEDWYRKLDPRFKFMYWYFEVEGTLLKIPRPFELGVVFSAMPEAMFDAWYQDDPQTVAEWGRHAYKVTVPDPQPVLFKEGIEQASNWDQWGERPIVSQGLSRNKHHQQFNEYTSKLAIFLGDTFRKAGAEKVLGRRIGRAVQSPQRIDHAIRGVGGRLSGDIVGALGLGPPGFKQNTEPADRWLVGRFFKRGGELGTRSRDIDEMYQKVQDLKLEQNDIYTKETPEQRQTRLMAEDGTRAVSNLLAIRRLTDDFEARKALVARADQIAGEVLVRIDEGDTARTELQFLRKTTDFDRKVAETPDPAEKDALRVEHVQDMSYTASAPKPERRMEEADSSYQARIDRTADLASRAVARLKELGVTKEHALKALEDEARSKSHDPKVKRGEKRIPTRFGNLKLTAYGKRKRAIAAAFDE